MKKIALLVVTLFIATPVVIHAKKDKVAYQTVIVKNETTGEFTYEGVVTVEHVSKSDMFNRAKAWIIGNIKTADNNVQYDSSSWTISNSGSVVLNPTSGFWGTLSSGFVNFKMNVMFKDGRYKFVFNNIVLEAIYNGSVITGGYDILKDNKMANVLKKDINEKLLAITTQLEAAIKNEGNKSDNW